MEFQMGIRAQVNAIHGYQAQPDGGERTAEKMRKNMAKKLPNRISVCLFFQSTPSILEVLSLVWA